MTRKQNIQWGKGSLVNNVGKKLDHHMQKESNWTLSHI